METEVHRAIGALRMAIRIEQNGYRFYRRVAEETDEPKAAELFNGLAEDEIAHERMLKTRVTALEREGSWLPVDEDEWPTDVAHSKAEAIFSRERIEQGKYDYTSELSALRMAYLIEKNAVEFYTKAARETADPVGKGMYEDLAEWERGHQRILEEEYRFLLDQFKLDMGFAPF